MTPKQIAQAEEMFHYILMGLQAANDEKGFKELVDSLGTFNRAKLKEIQKLRGSLE